MRQQGFTIIELVIALTVVVILLSIGVIRFNIWTQKYNIENEVKQLYADITEARIRAMGSNRFRFVQLTSTQYVVYDDTDYDGVLNAGDAIVLRVSTSKNPLTWSPSGNTQITFDRNGLASGLATTDTIISIANNVNAAYDCISITQTKTALGKINGTACAPK